MAEHILANIDFSDGSSTSIIQQKLALQLAALSFSIGSKFDCALMPYELDQEYLSQIKKLNLPVSDYVLWDTIDSHKIINPWIKTKKLIEECESKQLSVKYPLSDIEIKTASKAFAFKLLPPPFLSTLLQSKKDVFEFLKSQRGLFVLKSPLQQSGMGHYFISASEVLSQAQLPEINYENIRVEKWVHRLLDFSSQWLLDETVNCLGLCEIINNEKGGYKGSKFPLVNSTYECFFKEHIEKVKPVIHELHKQGYRGHLGVDAFIYEENKTVHLCPLIELNPRKTMGFVALNLSTHLEKHCHIEITNKKSANLLLPTKVIVNDSVLKFKSNLEINFF